MEAPRRIAHGPDGKFIKGSGGRPKGSKNHVTVQCEQLLEGEAEILTRRLIELAKQGEPTALRLCIERIAPLRKGRPLQGLARRSGENSIETILRSVLDGELTPDEGKDVVNMIESAARIAATKAMAEMRQQQLEVLKCAAAQGVGSGVMLVPLPQSVDDWESLAKESQKLLKEKVRE